MSDQIKFFLSLDQWILSLILVFLFAVLSQLFAKHFLRHAKKVSDMTDNIWDDAIIDAAELPLVVLIWLIAAKYVFNILVKEFNDHEIILAVSLVKISVILCFAWFLMRLIKNVAQSLTACGKDKDNDFDHTTIDAFAKLAKIIVIVLAALFIIQDFGVSISGILAAGGAGGLVIGFAAKDMFANLFGGLTIYLDRPFSVGDWIRCDEKKIEGVVEYIGWRHTRLRGLNKNPIYVPNSVFTTVVVENPSRMTHRRIKETIGIHYADIDKMTEIVAQIKKMLDSNSKIDHEQNNIVNFDSFNQSSIDIAICAFTKVVDAQEYAQIKQDILLNIASIIKDNGAKIAFPTHSVYLENEISFRK